MRESVPGSIDELRNRNLSAYCPKCNDTVTLNPVAGPINTHDHSYFIARCPNTKRLLCPQIFAVYQALNDIITDCYPIPSFDPDWMDKSIPQGIREVYAEARRCSFAKAYRGAAVMCRRVVEAAACDKLGPAAQDAKGRTKRLLDLIDEMHSQGLITADLKESTHEIRLFGNYGAHVNDDGLDSVSADEASAVRKIAWQLLHTLYVAPEKTAELRKKRQSKGSP